jgi:protocatechuate 3,4-dioxygenase beta subunit
MTHDAQHDIHDHDRGLAFDLSTLMARRQVLKLMAGASLLTLVGCGGSSRTATTTSGSAAASTTSAAAVSASSCAAIPEETTGPFPADGSNGVNILDQSGIVRSDITTSFGSASAVAEGVPLRIELAVLDTTNGCTPLAGAAVYLWHCNADGAYSLYDGDIAEENYLRGVQETDAGGKVSFTSIFPAAYSGRWPHIHFEVYRSVAEATSAGVVTATSQIALPADVCEVVYATQRYEPSAANLAGSLLESDNVFGDGATTQLATVTGSVESGYVAALSVPV